MGDTADFVAAAAREEMGKLHLLLDMCRLDFARHKNYLKRLCWAFYDHITKHAYFDYCTRSYAGIQTMSDLGHHFNLTRQQWWPAFAKATADTPTPKRLRVACHPKPKA